MNGNVKVKISDKQAEELEVILETYSGFSESLIKELKGAIHENDR